MNAIRRLRLFGPALAVAAVMTLGSNAQAEPTAPAPMAAAPAISAPASESEQLARHMVGSVLGDMQGLRPMYDLVMVMAEGQIQKTAKEKGGPAAMAYQRFAGWTKLLGDAAWEEFDHDRPVFEEILGRYMAKKFTVEELRATAALCDSPAAKEFRTGMMAKMINHDQSVGLSPASQRIVDAYKASPEGKSFLAKLKGLDKDPDIQPVAMDLLAAWLPGAMRRWGEKAEASEAARRAAMIH